MFSETIGSRVTRRRRSHDQPVVVVVALVVVRNAMTHHGVRHRALVAALVAALVPRRAHGFYLPGVAPQDYERDDLVYIKVNKLTSTVTQLPYEYYSLPYCKPDKVKHAAENLGEVLRGDRIENSLYSLEMRFDDQCKVQCKEIMTEEDAKLWKSRIEDEYRVMMYVCVSRRVVLSCSR